MATLASSVHRIGYGAPPGFDKQVDVVLQLQYRINQRGNYEWSYKSACTPNENQMFLAESLHVAAWSPFAEQDEFETSLDIGINGADTLVQVDTVGPHLLWSLQKDAVMTDGDHADVYGELRYWDGYQWLRREDFGEPTCGRIRFKAKYLRGDPYGQKHKFSYNVSLFNSEEIRVEHEIDPDIQNPRT